MKNAFKFFYSLALTAVLSTTLLGPMTIIIASESKKPTESYPVEEIVTADEPQEEEEEKEEEASQGRITEEAVSTSAEEEVTKEDWQKVAKPSKYTEAQGVVYKNITRSQTYTSANGKDVKVTFTKLPSLKTPISLKIEKVSVGETINSKEVISPAYDISTDPVINGQFEAKVSLLKNVETDNLEVNYSTDGINFQAQKVDSVDDMYATTTVDHFTSFVLVGSIENATEAITKWKSRMKPAEGISIPSPMAEIQAMDGYIQGRTFIDEGANGMLLQADGDYPDGMTDGFSVRLYDDTWTELETQTTNTTGDLGQFRFEGLDDANKDYYVCGVNDVAGYVTSPADLGQTIVDTNGNPTSYAAGEIVANESTNKYDESAVCWEITLDGDDGAYVGIGYIEMDTPENYGWNLQSEGSAVGDTPVDLACDPSGTVYITDGTESLSNVWSDITVASGTDVDYIRHNVKPDLNELLLGKSNRVRSENHADFDSEDSEFIADNLADSYDPSNSDGWGGFGGSEGEYVTRVRAFVDENNNGKYDLNEPITSWSNSCSITLDTEAPDAPEFEAPSAPGYFTHAGDKVVGGQTYVEMSFMESSATDIDYYEYEYLTFPLGTTGAGSNNTLDMTSIYGFSGCTLNDATQETCTWVPPISIGRKNIHRVRAVDFAGHKSPWSNWDGEDFSTIMGSEVSYEDYKNGTGVFGLASYIDGKGGFMLSEDIAPESNITTADFLTNQLTADIAFGYTDADTEVKEVDLYMNYNGGAYSPVVTDKAIGAITGNDTFAGVNLDQGDGEYCFYTIAEDVADDLLLDLGDGNFEAAPDDQCELMITLDTTPPADPIFWVEEDTSEVLVAWKEVADAEKYKIYRDEVEIAEATGVTEYTDTITGNHTYLVTAVDAAGNESTVDFDTDKRAVTFDYVVDDSAMENDWQSTGTGMPAAGDKWQAAAVAPGSNGADEEYVEFRQNFVGGDHYTYNSNAASETGYFEWTTSGNVASGYYEVYVQFDCTQQRQNAIYNVYSVDGSGTETFLGTDTINQGSEGSHCVTNGRDHHVSYEGPNWIKLDGYYPAVDEAIRVELVVEQGQNWIIADAVALKKVGDVGQAVGVKYYDLNENNTQDSADEPMMDGWEVSLFDENGDLVSSQESRQLNWPGQYRFTDIPYLYTGSTYYLCEETDNDVTDTISWKQSAPLVGQTNDEQSWTGVATGDAVGVEKPEAITADVAEVCWEITLSQGNDLANNVKFGNIKYTSIEGIKFNDLNDDNDQDADEPGVEGFTIYIDENADGVYTEGEPTTTTDAAGYYYFEDITLTDLTEGNLTVCEVNQTDWEVVDDDAVNTTGDNYCKEVAVDLDQLSNEVNFANYQPIETPMPSISISNFSHNEGDLNAVTTYVNNNTVCNNNGAAGNPCNNLIWEVKMPGGAYKQMDAGAVGTFNLTPDANNYHSVVQNYIINDMYAKTNNFFIDDPINPQVRVRFADADYAGLNSTAQVTVNNVLPDVSLSATAGGTTVTEGNSITVSPGTTVSFSGSFTDLAGNFDAGPAWFATIDYGPGGTINGSVLQQNPTDYNVAFTSYTYNTVGTYNVQFQVCEENNIYGFCSTEIVTINVGVAGTTGTGTGGTGNVGGIGTPAGEAGEEGEVAGEATFDFDLPEGVTLNPRESFMFSITASGLSQDEITCEWDFGDGSDLVTTAEVDMDEVEHDYAEEGEYELTVICKDKDGNEVSKTSEIIVSANAEEMNGNYEADVAGESDENNDNGEVEGNFIQDNLLLIILVPVIIIVIILILVYLSRKNEKSTF